MESKRIYEVKEGSEDTSKCIREVVKVYSIPVDTLHPEQFFGPKTVMKAPFAWEDWYVAIAAALLFTPFLLALIYLVKRIRDNKPIIRKVKVEPKLPPHQQAMPSDSAILLPITIITVVVITASATSDTLNFLLYTLPLWDRR